MSHADTRSPSTPPAASGRCRTLVRSMMLLAGITGAGYAVDAVPVVTVTDATGVVGAQKVTSAANVTYKIVFDKAVFPKYLTTGMLSTKADVAATAIYDLFNITTPGSSTATITQLSGSEFQVVVAGLADTETASLAVVADKWATASAAVLAAAVATAGNASATAVTVTRYAAANKPAGFAIATPSYTGFLNNPSISGTVTKSSTGADSGNNPNGSVVALTAKLVNSSGTAVSALAGNATAAGTDNNDAVWTYTPATAPANGLFYFAATAADAAGNAITGTPNVSVYVWKQPSVVEVKQNSTYIPFADTMKVSKVKPDFKGYAGIDEGDAAIGSGNDVQVTVDIFSAFSDDGNDNNDTKAIATQTADIVGAADNDGTAANRGVLWTFPDTKYSASLAAGTYTLRVNTKVTGTNASLNSISTLKTFTVQTSTTSAPTLTVASSRPDHLPKVTIASWPAGVSDPTSYPPVSPATGDSSTIKMQVSGPASLSTALAGSNDDVTLTALSPDSDGNSITLALVDPGANNAALSIAVSGSAITASLATGAGGAITTTATQLCAAINGDAAASALVVAKLKSGNDGSGAVSALSATNLTGGGVFSAIAGKVYKTAGVYTWYADAALPDGRYRFKATVTDSAGSTSDLSAAAPSATTPHIIATPVPVIAVQGSGSGTPGAGTPSTPVPVGGSPDPDYQYILSVRKPVFKVSSNSPTGNTLTADTTGDLVVYMVPRSTTGVKFDAVDDDANSGTDDTDFDSAKIVPGTYTYVGAGNATWTPTDPLIAGSYSLAARWVDKNTANTTAAVNDQTDGLNALSAPSNVFNFRIISAVDRPVVTLVRNGADDTTLLDTSTATTTVVSSGSVVLKGTANAGATLRIYNNGVLQPTKVIATPGTGAWSYAFTGAGVGDASVLPSGTNKITVQQVDLTGTASPTTTTSINIVVDSKTPAAPVVTAPVSGSIIADLKPTFKGTALANSTVLVKISGVSTDIGTDGEDQSVLVSPTGTWEMAISDANKLTAGTNYSGTIQFRTKSPAGIYSAYTNHSLDVRTAGMSIDLVPLARGTAVSPEVDNTTAYSVGATVIKVKKGGGTAGTILTGDSITIAGNTYIVGAGNTVPATGSVTITLRTGLKAAIANSGTVGITLNANPNAVTSKNDGNTAVSSLPSVLLQATLKNGANPVPSVLASAFTKEKVKVINGTIASVTKGTGLAGQQATNVWTIAVTPTTTATATPAGELQVWIPEGAFSNAPGKEVTSISVTAPGGWYSAAPKITVTGGSGFESTATATLADGVVTRVDVLNGGSGYASAPTVTIAAPSSGTTATATASIANGAVTAITITNGGTGYTSAPVITIAAPTSGITARAAATLADKALSSFTISNAGWGYASAPTITIAAPSGTGAKATAAVSAGAVTGFTVSAGGSGYASAAPPVVRISAGEGAVARPVISAGKITGITRISGGQFYSQAPTITITDSGGGSGATATATLSGGVITGFTVGGAGGSGYTANTIITIAPSATGATGTAVVNGSGVVTGITLGAGGSGYTAAPYVTLTTGAGAVAKANLTDGALVFNKASDSDTDASTVSPDEKYSLNINRNAPVVTWTWAAGQPVDNTSQLRPVVKANGSSYAANDTLSGAFFVNQQTTASTTHFRVRATFSPPLGELLTPTDLTLVGCSLDSSFGTAGISAVQGSAPYSSFDIEVLRGTGTGDKMAIGVKAGIANSSTVPAVANAASQSFVATIVSQTSGKPVIASPTGAAAPARGSKVASYSCTITFPNQVRACLPENLTVTNGVITKWTGSGKVFSFTVTPGEGQVKIKYENTATNKVYDVAGNEVVSSDEFTRLLDSTQPVITQISSPVFKKMNTATQAAAATATLKIVDMAITTAGSGYAVGDTIGMAGSSGTGATATVSGVDGSGGITGVTVTDGGSGFTANTSISISTVTGTGSGAAATYTMGVGAFAITQAGLGFGGAPVISLTGGGGSGAVVSSLVDINGSITGITVSDPGTGYTSAPTVVVNNSVKPMNGSTVVNRFPVRVTFTEAVPAFPLASLTASASSLATGTAVTIEAPKAKIDLAIAQGKAKPVGPQVVEGTGGTVYEFDLVVPTPTTQAGTHEVRLVVPSQGVMDDATNPSQASQVYSFTYDMVNGMPFEVTTLPVYSNG